MMDAYHTIVGQLMSYLVGLDWSFIVTFILLAYAINQPKTTALFTRLFKYRLRTRYRTLIVGVVYATTIFFLRGKALDQVELLFKSLLFAMIFHKLMIEQVVRLLKPGRHHLPGNHFISKNGTSKKQ